MNNLKNFEQIILAEMAELGPKLFVAGEKVAELEKMPENSPASGYSKAYVDALEEYSELSGRNDALHDLISKIS